MTDIFNTVAVRASGLRPDVPAAAALSARDDILTMTQQAHDAALTPVVPGGLPHPVRAALACRMARLNREAALAAHFQAMMGGADAPVEIARLSDPEFDGGADAPLRAILRHTDLVTTETRNVVAGDIVALTGAGVSEDDIVRLSELIAFVSYQVRLTVGLRLMGEAL